MICDYFEGFASCNVSMSRCLKLEKSVKKTVDKKALTREPCLNKTENFKHEIFAKKYETPCTIWYHFYNLKYVQNTHGGVTLLVKL